MVKIAVLVSGGGTNLQALIDYKARGRIKNGKLNVCVSSNPNAYALERARENKIECLVMEQKNYKDDADYAKALIEELQKRDIGLIVLAGFMKLLDRSFIEAFEGRILNVHPSLIPSFCGKGYYGLKVHQAVLDYGVKVTGATVHFVNEIPDGGKIILQKAVKVLKNDTAQKLQLRVMKQAEWVLLPKAVEMFCNGEIK